MGPLRCPRGNSRIVTVTICHLTAYNVNLEWGTVEIVTFGNFEVNLRTGELRKRGIRLPLQDQPLKILTALLERPGEVVRREELCLRLWPQGTFVDFEHSL